MSDVSISSAIGAPEEITIAGKKFMLSPFRFKEWAAMEQWMRAKIVAIAHEAIEMRGAMSEEDKRLVLSTAFDRASSLSFSDRDERGQTRRDIKALLSSPDGVIKTMSLSLRRQHPELTEDAVMSLADDVDDAKMIVERIFAMSGAALKVKESGEAPK